MLLFHWSRMAMRNNQLCLIPRVYVPDCYAPNHYLLGLLLCALKTVHVGMKCLVGRAHGHNWCCVLLCGSMLRAIFGCPFPGPCTH